MFEIMSQWGEYELREIADAQKRASICGVSEAQVKSGVKAIMLSDSVEDAAQRQLRFIIADSGHCSTLVKVEKVEFVEKHILIMSEVAFPQTSGRFLKLVIQMKQKKRC